jgi:hypothetical protein
MKLVLQGENCICNKHQYQLCINNSKERTPTEVHLPAFVVQFPEHNERFPNHAGDKHAMCSFRHKRLTFQCD